MSDYYTTEEDLSWDDNEQDYYHDEGNLYDDNEEVDWFWEDTGYDEW